MPTGRTFESYRARHALPTCAVRSAQLTVSARAQDEASAPQARRRVVPGAPLIASARTGSWRRHRWPSPSAAADLVPLESGRCRCRAGEGPRPSAWCDVARACRPNRASVSCRSIRSGGMLPRSGRHVATYHRGFAFLEGATVRFFRTVLHQSNETDEKTEACSACRRRRAALVMGPIRSVRREA